MQSITPLFLSPYLFLFVVGCPNKGMIRLVLALFLLCEVSLAFATNKHNETGLVRDMLNLRLRTLKRFALQDSHSHRKTCSTSQYIIITEIQWGRTGNQLIALTHGVWFAEKFNATLVVPKYMHNVFEPFDTTVLQSLFCYSLQDPPSDAKRIEITSEEMFFGFKVYLDDRWKNVLGPFTDNTRIEISRYLLRFYAALWSSPKDVIVRAAEYLVSNHLNGNFQYSSVHMRQLEGGCSKVMGHVSKPTDFSDKELPMNREEWKTNLHKWHPLCDMDYEFINAVFTMHKRNGSFIFVAHDARSDVRTYVAHNAVVSSLIQNDELKAGYDIKYLDMFMCINSDFFVLNPRSTFSLQIMATRLILSLPSVPTIHNNDIFLQKVPEELESNGRNFLWITWDSMLEAILRRR